MVLDTSGFERLTVDSAPEAAERFVDAFFAALDKAGTAFSNAGGGLLAEIAPVVVRDDRLVEAGDAGGRVSASLRHRALPASMDDRSFGRT